MQCVICPNIALCNDFISISTQLQLHFGSKYHIMCQLFWSQKRLMVNANRDYANFCAVVVIKLYTQLYLVIIHIHSHYHPSWIWYTIHTCAANVHAHTHVVFRIAHADSRERASFCYLLYVVCCGCLSSGCLFSMVDSCFICEPNEKKSHNDRTFLIYYCFCLCFGGVYLMLLCVFCCW